MSKQEHPLKKYFDAETSQEEERSLLSEMAQSDQHPDAPYFIALQQLKAKRKTHTRRRNYFMAASVAVLLALGAVTIPYATSTQDITNAETAEAYEETQKALMLLSNKLNQSSQKMAPVGQFEKTKKELEQKKVESRNDSTSNAKID